MHCPACKLTLVESKGTGHYARSLDGEVYEEKIDEKVCPAGCKESHFFIGKAMEAAEDNIGIRVRDAGKSGPQAVRQMTRSVFIDEFVIRFPTLPRGDVKYWRHGKGIVPDEVVAWARSIAETGYPEECLCGGCLMPRSLELPPKL
jgi:hypothetical protein